MRISDGSSDVCSSDLKAQGAGTGLGLSMIYGFVRQSRGQLSIDSAVGQGTTIWMYLPRHDGPLVDPVPAVERSAPAAGAGETVLLVDDDPLGPLFAVELLAVLGSGAIVSSDAAAAVIARFSFRVFVFFFFFIFF